MSLSTPVAIASGPSVVEAAPTIVVQTSDTDLGLKLSQRESALDVREQLLDRKEREFERRDREIDRRERELERRERELERRQREFEQEKGRSGGSLPPAPPQTQLASLSALEKALEDLKKDFTAERKRSDEERQKTDSKEAEFEARVMVKVNEILEKERHNYYGFMRMSDNEVSEMVEDTVGYLMQKVDNFTSFSLYI